MSTLKDVLCFTIVFVALINYSSSTTVSAEVAIVEGTVTLDGNPLADGKITFYDGDQFVGAKIKQGKFRVTNAALGQRKAVIEGKGVPAKFSSEETAPLVAQFKAGKNVFDFALQN